MSENTEVMAVEETAATSAAPEAKALVASQATNGSSDAASTDSDFASDFSNSDFSSQDLDPNSEEAGRVVRMLSVGQPVKGMVKRVSDFGLC